jgi:hypothetical protein
MIDVLVHHAGHAVTRKAGAEAVDRALRALPGLAAEREQLHEEPAVELYRLTRGVVPAFSNVYRCR